MNSIRIFPILCGLLLALPVTAAADQADAGDTLVAQATITGGAGSPDEQLIADAADATDEPSETSGLPITLNASLSFQSTLGHLFRDSLQARSGMSSSLGLSASYQFAPSVSASLSGGYLQYLTRYGGSVSRYEGRFQDITVGASHASVWREPTTGINLALGGSAILPTSAASRFTQLYTTLGASMTLSRSFGGFSLSLQQRGSKNFHRYTSIVADLDRYPIDALARAESIERITETRVALQTGLLTSHALATQLTAAYRIIPGLSVSASYALSNSWTYDNGTITEQDEFTSPNARVGRGYRQGSLGSFGVRYAFLDHYSAGLNFSTAMSPRSADNSRLRFPFWDFESGNLQYTTVSLSLSGSY
ncbi:MAG: hypothetical protein EA398_07320 [Deltaproteobacteria bacterium]|nr:MAG: hypothetical protein EA398_07320 [Deltaproteobacteria bacterium]